MNVKSYIQQSRTDVRRIVRASKLPGSEVFQNQQFVSRYTLAFAGNFTDWLGRTLPFVRHEASEFILKDNLRCESEQDHVGMLLRLKKGCNVTFHEAHFDDLQDPLEKIRSLFTDSAHSGLNGMMLLTLLENTSLEFIPVLEQVAKKLGCEDLTYTRAHGCADHEHSKGFAKALDEEIRIDYHRLTIAGAAHNAREAVRGLLQRIFGVNIY